MPCFVDNIRFLHAGAESQLQASRPTDSVTGQHVYPSPLIDDADDLAHGLSVTNAVLAVIRTRHGAILIAAYL